MHGTMDEAPRAVEIGFGRELERVLPQYAGLPLRVESRERGKNGFRKQEANAHPASLRPGQCEIHKSVGQPRVKSPARAEAGVAIVVVLGEAGVADE